MKNRNNFGVSKGEYKDDLADLLFGSRGECKIEDLTSDKDYCVGIYRDGVWESRRNDIGRFSYLKQEVNIPYLSKDGENFFELNLPLVPYGLILGIAEFFKKIMVSHSGAEAMVQVWWNKSEEKYQLYVPVQMVGGASVRFEHSKKLQNDKNLVWAIDIHSHNTMAAFFSAGDNADEKSTRMFGVLGQLDHTQWVSKWRAGCNGQYVNLEIEDIFDKTNNVLMHIPDSECEKVSKISYARNNALVGGLHTRNSYNYPGYNSVYNNFGIDDDIYKDYSRSIDSKGFNLEEDELLMGLMADPELETIVKELIELNELKENYGVELKTTVRKIISYLCEFGEFSTDIAVDMIDEISLNLEDSDFESFMEKINEYK